VQVAINIFNNIKRIIKNESFEIEGGNSISGRKGTEFILEVDEKTQIATYTVNEGIVDVWLANNPSTKREVTAGESVRVTETTIEKNDTTWDELHTKYNWTLRDISDYEEMEGDNDSVSAISDGSADIKNNRWIGFAVVIVIILIGVTAYLSQKAKKQ